MDTALLRQLGTIDQIAGIRESVLLRGRSAGTRIAEFYNAAGLRFTVVPDCGMNLYDFSYRGVNFSFQSKNGLVAPQFFSPMDGEFVHQWSGGMLATCGLDNVGGHVQLDGAYPTHGRIGQLPASTFGVRTWWEQEQYHLRAEGEMHQTCLYGRHLSLRREITTGLYAKSLQICDTVTNLEAEEEPYMLLYHFNFGYPLVQPGSRVAVSGARWQGLNDRSTDPEHLRAPEDRCGEELFLHTGFGGTGCAVVYNEELELGTYISFETKNLPNLLQWKLMKSHDYVLAFEPCNTCGLDRAQAAAQDRLAKLPGYASIQNRLELGVLDGLREIRGFIQQL